MVHTQELARLRRLNVELLRRLWAGQDATRRSVAKAAAGSKLGSCSSYTSEVPSSQEMSSVATVASCLWDADQDEPRNTSSPGWATSGVIPHPHATGPCRESPSTPRPSLASWLATLDSSDPEHSAELEAPTPKAILDQESEPAKPRVTFSKESAVPEKSWRLRPYLGYDWIAGSLDNSSPVGSRPESFFSKLQEFREANKDECVHSDAEALFLGPQEGGATGAEAGHECVYCYRVNRRLFLVPADPGTRCRLCRTPRDQRGPETLAQPARVRVSVPLSVLDPPHLYRIHRRKSFDASDTLSLPRHCLRGWDILPPKSEKSSAPRSLDLWSCVASEAQRRQLSASPRHPARPVRELSPTPIRSEPPVPRPRAPWRKP